MGSLISRNVGIDNANSEYILFVDSDDYIIPETCKELYDLAVKTNADIINCGVEIINSDNLPIGRIKGIERYMTPYPGIIAGNTEILNKCFQDSAFNSNLCTKFIRTEICKKTLAYTNLEAACMAEDLLAFFVIAYFSHVFVGTDKKYYHYCYGRGLTGKNTINIDTFSKYCTQAKIVDSLKNFLQTNNIYEEYSHLYECIKKRLLSHCLGSWKRLTGVERGEGYKLLISHWGCEQLLDYIFTYEIVTPSAYVSPTSEKLVYIQPQNDSRSIVLSEFYNGKIGFKYIAKYFVGWVKYKIFKSRK